MNSEQEMTDRELDLPEEMRGLAHPLLGAILCVYDDQDISDSLGYLAEYLFHLIKLRRNALTVKPYKEHSFEEILKVSKELIPDHSEWVDPHKGLTQEEKDQVYIQQRLEQREKAKIRYREVRDYYDYIMETVTPYGLCLLVTFHHLVDFCDTDIRNIMDRSLKARKVLLPRFTELRLEYGDDSQIFHVIPELIDWNVYLTLRGEKPETQTPYPHLLRKVWKLHLRKRAEQRSKEYLDEHPMRAVDVLLGRDPDDKGYFRRSEDQGILLTLAAKRAKHFSKEQIDRRKRELMLM